MTTALTEIAEQELFIVEELRAKEFNRLDLVAMKAKTALDIEITDKLSYKIVHDAQIELRDNRTRITKGRLLFTEWLTKQTKDAIQCEKDLIARIQPTEEALKAKKEAYDKEQDRIKKEKEEAELLVLQERLEELQKYGVIQDIWTVKAMSDEGFRMMADQWKKKWEEKEAIRIAEEEKKRLEEEAETARIKKEQDDLAEQVRLQQAENARIAEENRKESERIRIENEKIAESNRKQAEENARNAQAIVDKENEMKRQDELKQAQESARLQAIEDEKARVESERVAKEQKEKEDAELLLKNTAFNTWLSNNWMTHENRTEFEVRYENGTPTLWKKISTFA